MMRQSTLRLSTLPKTWILDLDGLLVPHNGHLSGPDRLLPGVADFVKKIGPHDKVVLLSSRDPSLQDAAIAFLKNAGIHAAGAVFGLPHGERILFNDRKPSGLATAHAVNLDRDQGLENIAFMYDPAL